MTITTACVGWLSSGSVTGTVTLTAADGITVNANVSTTNNTITINAGGKLDLFTSTAVSVGALSGAGTVDSGQTLPPTLIVGNIRCTTEGLAALQDGRVIAQVSRVDIQNIALRKLRKMMDKRDKPRKTS